MPFRGRRHGGFGDVASHGAKQLNLRLFSRKEKTDMREPEFAAIIVHVPHASTEIPEDVRQDFVLTDDGLQGELRRFTDHYTDELFGVKNDRVTVVRYPVSRLVADPERFPDDADEPLAEIGLGAVYAKTSHLEPLRRERRTVSREQLFARYYTPHHERLLEAVDRGLAHGPVLIIDAHSYPKKAFPFEQDETGKRGQICLGTDSFHTPEPVLRGIRERFEEWGYSVSIDTPFKGSIVPLQHYGKSDQVSSIMIELRRDIYMNEATGERSKNFAEVRDDVETVVRCFLQKKQTREERTPPGGTKGSKQED